MIELTDKQLIIDYLAGEEEAFTKIVDRYLALVLNFVNSLVNDRRISEDITQEAFLKIWKSLDKFDQERNFRTWMLTIAKNTTIDVIRKQKIKNWEYVSLDNQDSGLIDLPSFDLLPDEVFYKNETAILVNNLIKELKPAERAVINLHYQDQLTFEEISEVLGESVNTVKSRHRRILLKLREKI